MHRTSSATPSSVTVDGLRGRRQFQEQTGEEDHTQVIGERVHKTNTAKGIRNK